MDQDTTQLLLTFVYFFGGATVVLVFMEIIDRRLYGYLLQFWKYHIEQDGQQQPMHPQTYRPLKEFYNKLLKEKRNLHEAALIRLVLNGAIVYKHKWTGKYQHKYRWKINKKLTFKSEIPPIPWSYHLQSIRNSFRANWKDLRGWFRKALESLGAVQSPPA